ncbi:MAG: helix-turn-helix transcriptional regulator [Nitrospirae bacterium]|nr:helix-turn-helix transcriptional regulator [Nitrospirota bacterium]
MVKYKDIENDSAAIAERIRSIRKRLGLSQEQLGEIAGVTYQQIQKYEKGKDRISANRLKKIAEAINIPINYFFEEIPAKVKEREITYNTVGQLTKEEIELIKLFRRVEDKRARENLLKLIKSARRVILER